MITRESLPVPIEHCLQYLIAEVLIVDPDCLEPDENEVTALVDWMTEHHVEKISGRESLVIPDEDGRKDYHIRVQRAPLAPIHTPDGPLSEPSTQVRIFVRQVGHEGGKRSVLFSNRVFVASRERSGG